MFPRKKELKQEHWQSQLGTWKLHWKKGYRPSDWPSYMGSIKKEGANKNEVALLIAAAVLIFATTCRSMLNITFIPSNNVIILILVNIISSNSVICKMHL